MANITPTSPVYSSSTLINSLLKRVNNGSNDTTVMYSQDINWSDILVEDINDMLGTTGHVDHFNETAEVLTVLDRLFQEIYKGSNGILTRLDALEQGSKTLTLSKGTTGSIFTNVNVVASTSDPITLSTTAGVFGSTSGATQTTVTGSTNIPVYNKNKGTNATMPTITLVTGATADGLCMCSVTSDKTAYMNIGFTGGIPSNCTVGQTQEGGSTSFRMMVNANQPANFYILNTGATNQNVSIQALQIIAGGNATTINPTVTASQQVTGLTGSVSLGTINGTKGAPATGIQVQGFTVPGTPQVTYYFSIGTTPVTADNYTTANNATTTIPTTTRYSPTQRNYHYILIPANKTMTIVDDSDSAPINITEQTSISIPNHKVYKTNGPLNVGGTARITLS